MKYDFETVVDRSTIGSAKWEQMKLWKPDVTKGIVPFSVADMELKNPPEVIEGLKKYLDSTVLGYTLPTDDYLKAVCGWMKRRHDWDIEPDWLVGSEGVVSAFFTAIRAFSEPGDGVIIQTPAYYPFYSAIERNGRRLVKNPLVLTGQSFVIDYEDLERKARDPQNKILLFCSPHNPTGRVWRREELAKIGEICLRNHVLIISDEIHFDLIMPGHKQTVFANVSKELEDNMVVCTAPSKTFNLAGMQTSNIVIPNPVLRAKFVKEAEAGGFFSMSILGYKACEIAYTKCEAWLDELIKLIYHNHLELKKYIGENIPQIKVFDLEGTYLQWMDFRQLGLDKEGLEKYLHEKAELFFDEGYVFGEEGAGFERMNLACPTRVMMDGLKRLSDAVKALHSKAFVR
jgi:aminotransferase/cystathionine beta-lyase